MFGAIDHFDKRSIQEKLKLFEGNTEIQTKFNFEYAKLIDKTITQLNDSVEVINHHTQILETIDKKIEELRKSANYHDFEIHTGFVLSNLMTRFNAIYFSTDNRISDIHQSMIDLQNNVMNTKFITFENIIEALKNLEITDKSLTFPFNLNIPNYETLRELSEYVVMLQDENLIVIFSIPLMENVLGNVQKFYSIPTMENKIAKFLDITNGYVIADKNINKYVDWNKERFQENCQKLNSQYFCKGLNVMSKETNSCTYKALVGFLKNIDKICGVKLLVIEKTLLIKTEVINKYITVTANQNFGSLVLENNTELIEFNGTQILSVQQKAI